MPRYSCRKASWTGPSFSSTGSTCVPSSELFSSRNTRLSSAAEIVSALTAELAITLTSLARASTEAKIINPAATRSSFGHFIAFSCASLRLEIKTGLNDQSVRVGLKALGVYFWIKSVRKCAGPIAVHEVPFHFHVPEFFQIDPRRDDFVVDVIGGQAGVSLDRGINSFRASGYAGYRIAGVVGA